MRCILPRQLSDEQIKALEDDSVIWGLFFDIHHPDGLIRCWNGLGFIEYTQSGVFNPPLRFTGVGHIAAFSGFENALRTRVQQIKMSMSGHLPADAHIRINTEVKGRSAFISLGLIKDERVVGNFINLLHAVLDYSTVQIDDNLETTITLNANSGLLDLRNPTRKALTRAEQEDRFPNIPDSGMDDIPQLANRNVIWHQGSERV